MVGDRGDDWLWVFFEGWTISVDSPILWYLVGFYYVLICSFATFSQQPTCISCPILITDHISLTSISSLTPPSSLHPRTTSLDSPMPHSEPITPRSYSSRCYCNPRGGWSLSCSPLFNNLTCWWVLFCRRGGAWGWHFNPECLGGRNEDWCCLAWWRAVIFWCGTCLDRGVDIGLVVVGCCLISWGMIRDGSTSVRERRSGSWFKL